VAGVDEQPLTGGVANAGAVVRVGDHVLRPAGPGTAGVHAFLQALAAAGFDGAPRPLGVDADGRQRLTYIEGDVALPPYPAWAQADPALAGLARLMARFHEAARAFDPSPHSWPAAVGDPAGGPVVCHNDVCLDNVVFRGGEPVALLDFDFAAPGRPVDDLAAMARMCVPVDDDANAARLGWVPADRPGRLRLVADAYGLTAAGRRLLGERLEDVLERTEAFVRARVAAGDPNFVAVWAAMGGERRFARRRAWWGAHRDRFLAALR
jgi:hypothetical protein